MMSPMVSTPADGTCRKVNGLPACLAHAGDEAVERHIAQRDTAQTEVAEIRARTPAHRTAIANARCRRITRLLAQRRVRRCLLFVRALRVLNNGLQLRTLLSMASNECPTLLVPGQLACFCHRLCLIGAYAAASPGCATRGVTGFSSPLKGMPSLCNNENACSSFVAVVTNVMSMP